ncbi:MAG: flagellar biosynthesis protein FlhF [Gammaproteobacteria bacterium]|nr:MAG: flagellar biosynthesis protein FlhF [Gammaproteobacteria bacterium]
MKIKRYVSHTGTSALAQAKAELGPEAVILSNRNVDGQVELVAAVDLEEQVLQSASAPTRETAPQPAPQDPALGDLQQELERLRGMLEGQLTQAAWRDKTVTRTPKKQLVNRLSRLGLSRSMSAAIADRAGSGTMEQQWQQAQTALSNKIQTKDGDADQTQKIMALVGSTGVGKTTTIAKLAARSVLRHGPRQVALITTDCYRIGGQEQLETFARYLGIPVMVATNGVELSEALDKVADRKLVLIDTAGMSQRDVRLYQQFATLKSVGRNIECHVVLSATALPGSLNEVVRVFGKDALSGAIVTKLDEASSLGGVIDVLIRHHLPVTWVSAGQKVPEDLRKARADELVRQACELTRQEQQNKPLSQHSIAV